MTLLEPPYQMPAGIGPFIPRRLAGNTVVMGNGSLESEDFVLNTTGWHIGNDYVEFNSDLTAQGTFRTAASGARIEIGTTAANYITFYDATSLVGSIYSNTGQTYMTTGGSTPAYVLLETAGKATLFGDSEVLLTSDDVRLNHGALGGDQIIFAYAGTTDFMTIHGAGSGVTINVPSHAMNWSYGSTYSCVVTSTYTVTSGNVTFDSSGIIVLDGDTNIQLKDNGTEYARFDYGVDFAGQGRLSLKTANGNVGGRVTLEKSTSGTYTVHVEQRYDGANDFWRIRGDNGTTEHDIVLFRADKGLFDHTLTGTALEVSSTDIIGKTSSSLRYKRNVRPMNLAQLANRARGIRPIWHEYDPESVSGAREGQVHAGLAAEEMALVFPELTGYARDGETPDTVHYHKATAVLWGLWLHDDQRMADLEARIIALENA